MYSSVTDVIKSIKYSSQTSIIIFNIIICLYAFRRFQVLQCHHHHHHHHHVALVARISLTFSRHSSLSFIALGRSSGQHPVSSYSWMYVRAGQPASARPCLGVHKSTSLMSSSLLLPAVSCMSGSSNLNSFRDREAGGRTFGVLWGVAAKLVQDCSQHSCVIAV